jgi:hypothetical protein
VTEARGPADPPSGEHDAAGDDPRPDGAEAIPARPVDRFRRTAAGSVVAAGLFGLRDALEGRPEREETAVVAEARTPADNGPIEVVLDFDRPGHGIVVIRRDPVGDSDPPRDASEGEMPDPDLGS